MKEEVICMPRIRTFTEAKIAFGGGQRPKEEVLFVRWYVLFDIQDREKEMDAEIIIHYNLDGTFDENILCTPEKGKMIFVLNIDELHNDLKDELEQKYGSAVAEDFFKKYISTYLEKEAS